MADIWVPLRAGSDIIFLGAMVNYILENNRDFREYVTHYTNAATLLRDDFRDTEDLDGFFSGWNAEKQKYDPETWFYRGSPSQGAEQKPGHSTAAGGHGKDRGGEAQDAAKFESDPSLQDPRCVFQVLKRHFARYTPEMVERYCGISQRCFPEDDRGVYIGLGPGKDRRHLLCRRVDATFKGRATDSNGRHTAIAARKYRPARWRDSGASRTRIHPRFD